jgi:hypothetical protein
MVEWHLNSISSRSVWKHCGRCSGDAKSLSHWVGSKWKRLDTFRCELTERTGHIPVWTGSKKRNNNGLAAAHSSAAQTDARGTPTVQRRYAHHGSEVRPYRRRSSVQRRADSVIILPYYSDTAHVYIAYIKNMYPFYDAATSGDLFYIKLFSVVLDEVRSCLGGRVEWQTDRQTDGITGRGEWTDSVTANWLYCILSTVYRNVNLTWFVVRVIARYTDLLPTKCTIYSFNTATCFGDKPQPSSGWCSLSLKMALERKLCIHVGHLKRNAQNAVPTEQHTRCAVKCQSFSAVPFCRMTASHRLEGPWYPSGPWNSWAVWRVG